LSVEDAYVVGTALTKAAVDGCKLSWMQAVGQA
jgi:hypothetical protein